MKKIVFVLIVVVIFVFSFWAVVKFFGNKNDISKQNATDNTTVQKEVFTPWPDQYKDDHDMDGIKDEDEKKLGTSQVEFDTDGDGLSDKIEVDVYHTNPTKPDTDGDGFWDGVEIMKGYDPNGPGKMPTK